MTKKRVVAMIPARMESSRFPGKPLARILELPMIEHVRRRVALSEVVADVYVATCNQEIFNTVTQYGGKAIMTANTHERCTDRVVEAIQKVEGDIVCVVQGDEPLFDPGIPAILVKPMLKDRTISCVNLLSVIRDEKDLDNIDIVKAVLDVRNTIMYFSRSPIPFRRVQSPCPMYRQTGISAFTKRFLHQYSKLPPTPMEIAESVDFLRILEHRLPILGVVYPRETVGVDRPGDIEKVEKILREDPAQQEIYKKCLSR